jgi:high-affinity nickel-transport protein
VPLGCPLASGEVNEEMGHGQRMPDSDKVSKMEGRSLRTTVLVIYGFLILANVGAWLWALELGHRNSIFIGTAILAYTLGMRHAVDADHIAAIDNVTRKLMQEGTKSASVGFYFALGHSAVVAAVTAAIAAATIAFDTQSGGFRSVSLISTVVSVVFLFVIAFANLFTFRSIYRAYSRMQKGALGPHHELDAVIDNRGVLVRLLRPIFGLVTKGWHMFAVGILFGLGFGTATEVTLVGISATQVAAGVSIWSMMVFPALFAAAMSLIDTTDGVLMLGVYNWAQIHPVRKLYYNLALTFTSVAVAVSVGTIEALG